MGSAPGILDKLQSSGDMYWDEFAREIWTVLRSSVVKNGAQLFELYSVLLKWRTERSCSGIVVKYDGIITTCGLGRVNSFRIRNDLNRTYMWPKGPLEAWSHLIWSNPRAPLEGFRFENSLIILSARFYKVTFTFHIFATTSCTFFLFMVKTSFYMGK